MGLLSRFSDSGVLPPRIRFRSSVPSLAQACSPNDICHPPRQSSNATNTLIPRLCPYFIFACCHVPFFSNSDKSWALMSWVLSNSSLHPRHCLAEMKSPIKVWWMFEWGIILWHRSLIFLSSYQGTSGPAAAGATSSQAVLLGTPENSWWAQVR